MELSIIIPAYNEEKKIAKTLTQIIDYVDSHAVIQDWEIIVVDDGSYDQTRTIVQKYIQKDQRITITPSRLNQGKGFSVREGALKAKYPTLLFSDADSSTPITEFDKFIPRATEFDIIIGSRALTESKVQKHQPYYREYMGKTFNKMVRALTKLNIHDTQCGFKFFQHCETIFQAQTMRGFSFDVELLYLAQKAGKKILEIPVIWINDERSSVSPIKDSFKMLRDLLKIKKIHG